MIDLHSVARALGGEISGRNQISCSGPNHSPGDRSLAVKFDPQAPDGFVVFSHAGDDPLACRDHVRRLLGWPQWEPGDKQDRRVPSSRVKEIDREDERRRRPMTDEELERIDRAVSLWDEATNPRNTLAETYLREHRKLDLPDDLAGRVLRFHANCPWRDENSGAILRLPALIAAFRSIDDDAVTGIHRIALRPDGTKIDRRMLGIVRGAAIKLDPNAERRIFIAEGLESAMAARELGFGPTWAMGSTGGIAFFPIIRAVRELMIHGETGKASEDAVKLCGRRWTRAGKRVRIAYSNIGDDFNDAVMRGVL